MISQKIHLFQSKFSKNFNFFRQFHKKFRFSEKKISEISIFSGNFTKISIFKPFHQKFRFSKKICKTFLFFQAILKKSIFSRQISEKIRFFRQFHKQFRFSRHKLAICSYFWANYSISLQKSPLSNILYIVRYNNILPPVHDPHDPLPKIWEGRDPPTPQD